MLRPLLPPTSLAIRAARVSRGRMRAVRGTYRSPSHNKGVTPLTPPDNLFKGVGPWGPTPMNVSDVRLRGLATANPLLALTQPAAGIICKIRGLAPYNPNIMKCNVIILHHRGVRGEAPRYYFACPRAQLHNTKPPQGPSGELPRALTHKLATSILNQDYSAGTSTRAYFSFAKQYWGPGGKAPSIIKNYRTRSPPPLVTIGRTTSEH